MKRTVLTLVSSAIISASAAIAMSQQVGISALEAPASLTALDQRIQGGVVTLAADRTAVWTYPYAYVEAPVISYVAASADATYPVQCNIINVTATQASVRCWKGAAVTVSLLGTSVNAFQGSVTGLQVHLHARPATQ